MSRLQARILHRHVDFRNPEDFVISAEVVSADGFGFGWLAEPNGQLNMLLLAARSERAMKPRAIVEQIFRRSWFYSGDFPGGTGWRGCRVVGGFAGWLRPPCCRPPFTVTEIAGDEITLDVAIEQRLLGCIVVGGPGWCGWFC